MRQFAKVLEKLVHLARIGLAADVVHVRTHKVAVAGNGRGRLDVGADRALRAQRQRCAGAVLRQAGLRSVLC